MTSSTIQLDGIPVSRLDFEATVAQLRTWMGGETPRRVATANADFLRLARSRPALRDALGTCDLVTADGMPLVWLGRLAGRPIAGRVAGVDLVDRLLAVAAEDGRRVYLLGGAAGAAQDVADQYRVRHPSLCIAGAEAPRVDLADDAGCRALAARVRATRADLVFVALGCPKQELFLERYLTELDCRVGIGVGGSFEMLSGRLKRAPRWLQGSGFEWAFRMLQEPRRLTRRYARDFLCLCRLAWRTGKERLA